MHGHFRSSLLAFTASLALAACHDAAGPGAASAPPNDETTALLDVPAVEVGLPPAGTLMLDDAAREHALAAVDFLAVVAFKEPLSRRIAESNGVRSAVSQEAARRALQVLVASGFEVRQVYGALGMALVRVPEGRLADLKRLDVVDFAEPLPPPAPRSRLAAPAGFSSVRERSVHEFSLLAQFTPWNVTMVGAPGAWQYSTGGNVATMQIGTGIAPHEDFSFVTGACGGLFNACNSTELVHGEASLGIMAARDNTIGVKGIAPSLPQNQHIIWRFVHDDGTVDWNVYLSGLNAARVEGRKVVLLEVPTSWYWQPEATALATAWAAGVVFVAPVGDNGIELNDTYPAAYPNVVGVSGVRDNGTFAGSPTTGCLYGTSNWGTAVDVAAPFYATTTINSSTGVDNYWHTRDVFGWCSTSIAAAHVAGVLALIRSHFPTLTPQQAVAKLFSTSSHPASRDNYIGFGIPNAAAALTPPPPALPPITVTIFNFTEVQPYAECLWVAGVSGGDGGPYNLSWTVDGVPVGDGTPNLRFANWGGADFTIMLNVTDNSGGAGGDTHYVIVNPYANYCWDM